MKFELGADRRHCKIRPTTQDHSRGSLGCGEGGVGRYMPLSYLGEFTETIKKKTLVHSKIKEPGSAILRKSLRHDWENLRQNGYLPNCQSDTVHIRKKICTKKGKKMENQL